jgi:hypothetical protein
MQTPLITSETSQDCSNHQTLWELSLVVNKLLMYYESVLQQIRSERFYNAY